MSVLYPSLLPKPFSWIILDDDKVVYPATSMPEAAMVTPPESVFDQLPSEIMGEIFLQCLLRKDYFVRPRSYDAPMVLCGVSHHWREVALSTPALWSSISVLFIHGQLRPNGLLARSWLERSGQHPLSIELVVEGDPRLESLAEVFQIFIPTYKRWRHARFDLCRAGHSALSLFPQNGLPLLEFLDINLESYDFFPRRSMTPFPDHLQHIFDESPRLRSLSWKWTHVKAPSLTTNQFLTELILDSHLAISECLLILSMCPKLEQCTFHNICKISSPKHPLPSIVRYDNLRRLHAETGTPIPTLFQSLTLPSLESLTVLESTRRGLPFDLLGAEQISNMIMRSSPPLKELTLENIPFVEDDLIQLLHSLNTLTVLDLNDEGSSLASRFTDKIVSALATRRSSDKATFLCPKLEVLRLRGCVASTDGIFAGMITLRLEAAISRSGVARLKAVHVEFGHTNLTPMQEHRLDVDVLKNMRAHGLNVRVFVR